MYGKKIYLRNNLKEKKISFVGYGRIAKLMHKYAKAFDMDVQAYDHMFINFTRE